MIIIICHNIEYLASFFVPVNIFYCGNIHTIEFTVSAILKCNSVANSTLTMMCNHPDYLAPKHFYYPKRKPHTN